MKKRIFTTVVTSIILFIFITNIFGKAYFAGDYSCIFSADENDISTKNNYAPTDVCTSLDANTIGGTVWEDWNFNGVRDEINIVGVENVTVEIYGCDNLLIGNTVTDIDGDWSFDVTARPSCGACDDLRIEYKNLPAWAKPTKAGTNSEGITQTVQPNVCGGLGVADLSDYCQDNPDLFISCYEAGTSLGANSTNTAVLSFPYNATGTNFTKTPQMTIGEAGATWGIAFDRKAERIFASTVLKRAIGMGEGANGDEPGYIFFNDLSDGTFNKFNLNGVTPANSADAISGTTIDLGSITRVRKTGNIASGAAGDFDISDDSTKPVRDMDAFGKAGKMSFGDIDVTNDNSHLWAVNLFQRALIQIDLSASSTDLNTATPAILGTLTQQYLIENLPGAPVCGNGDGLIGYDTSTGSVTPTSPGTADVGVTGVLRPWALEFHKGVGYLGVVCDASISLDPDDLVAYVLAFDPNNIAAGFTTETSFNLDFYRHPGNNGSAELIYNFQAWESNWDWVKFAGSTNPNNNLQTGYAQPIFTDIEFDPWGNIIVGIGDLWGMQNTTKHYVPTSGSTKILEFQPHGGLNFICKDNGSYEQEGTGTCPQPHKVHTSTFRYFETKRGDGRAFGAMGSLVLNPQRQEVVVPYIDPYPPTASPGNAYFSTQGLQVYNYTDGDKTDWLRITGPSAVLASKGQALGDIDLGCAAPPLEIGNFVWADTNENGLQEACEIGIDGVTVELIKAGNIIAETTTSNGGQYYFSSTFYLQNGTWSGTGIDTALLANTNYIVRIVNAEGGSQQVAISGTTLTLSNVNADTENTVDNDAILNNINDAEISFMTGNNGSVDHSLDFGFVPEFDYADYNRTGVTCTFQPCHQVSSNIYLGTGVTGDNGTPGTENAASDEDDGVLLGANLNFAPGNIMNLPLQVYNATGDDAYLRVWIDWNGDGDFFDTGENAVDATYDAATFNGAFTSYVPVTIPQNVVQGMSIAMRFRWSTDDVGSSVPCGTGNCAGKGELEDYLMQVNCPINDCIGTNISLLRKN